MSNGITVKDAYGPPPELQEELGWTRSSLRKCIRPLVENRLRAHDDDPRVPVLVIATVMKDRISTQVFGHAI